jgi:hypothetical protein
MTYKGNPAHEAADKAAELARNRQRADNRHQSKARKRLLQRGPTSRCDGVVIFFV